MRVFWWSNNVLGASWRGCYSSWQMHITITTDKEDIAKSLPMVEPSPSMVMCLARLWLKEQDKLKAYIWPPNELRCQCYKAIMECHWTMDEQHLYIILSTLQRNSKHILKIYWLFFYIVNCTFNIWKLVFIFGMGRLLQLHLTCVNIFEFVLLSTPSIAPLGINKVAEFQSNMTWMTHTVTIHGAGWLQRSSVQVMTGQSRRPKINEGIGFKPQGTLGAKSCSFFFGSTINCYIWRLLV